MNYKYGVYGGGTGNTKDNPGTNGVTFATYDEAERAGRELLSRWTQPKGFIVLETEEPANYEFLPDDNRPRSLE